MTATTANGITAKLLIDIPARWPALVRVWRRNVGSAVPYGTVAQALDLLSAGRVSDASHVLRAARTVAFGVAGEADIDGVVGPRGRRLAIEVKAGNDRQSMPQKAYQRMVVTHGGIYIVARSVEQAIADLAREVEG
jgi:hypothetical protein